MSSETVIRLKAGKDQSVLRFHPWVFSGAIDRTDGTPAEGDVVAVTDAQGKVLGRGHFTPAAITVRLLTFADEPIDRAFLRNKLALAWGRREMLGLNRPDNNIYRVVHGEGDNLPGLIIDRYDDVAVVQCHTVGFWRMREWLAELLPEVSAGAIRRVYNKSEGALPKRAPGEALDGWLLGEGRLVEGLENGLKFQVDVMEGQKTGFFVDQRENRALVEQLAKGKSVLNVFCYTGGFSVSALRGGATRVVSVDSSKKAMAQTDTHVALNFPDGAPHESLTLDAFDLLEGSKERFDLIILDPPAFAKHLSALTQALRAYRRINARAMELLNPGGVLFTFSCSQVVSRDDFRKNVFTAATLARRPARILYQLTQPADHPVNLYHPEGEYLKGLVVEVE